MLHPQRHGLDLLDHQFGLNVQVIGRHLARGCTAVLAAVVCIRSLTCDRIIVLDVFAGVLALQRFHQRGDVLVDCSWLAVPN